MKSLGRHLRLVRQFDVEPALPWPERRPPRARGLSIIVGLVLTVGALLVVGAVEQYARERLGVAR